MAVTAESTRFLVMGQPVASTTPSRALTYTDMQHLELDGCRSKVEL